MTTMHPFSLHHPRALGLTGLLALCLSLSGCDTPPTRVDQHFGQAVRPCAAPTASPQASDRPPHAMAHRSRQCLAHARAVSHETDGVTAKAAVDRYHDSLLVPATAAPVFNFNMGSSPAR